MMIGKWQGREFYHSVRTDFSPLLRKALFGDRVVACDGIVYATDPAAETVAPFIRSAKESGRDPDKLGLALMPDAVWQSVHEKRVDNVVSWLNDEAHSLDHAEDWTRAGLVLEVASRWGIKVRGYHSPIHVKWKMRGTVTGRFGVEGGGFNPLIIPSGDRDNILPSAGDRSLAVIDFRAMDLSSMIALLPTMAYKYEGATDLHGRTAEILGVERDLAKREIFVYAYGGTTPLADKFEQHIPEVGELRRRPGEHGVTARLIQTISANAFKAALAEAFPLLCGEDIRPAFAVHDELVLDVGDTHLGQLGEVTQAMERGASRRNGSPYTVGMKIGKTYAEGKA